jgi:hypothetical protein
MAYVVKATSPSGAAAWICQPGFASARTLGDKESAEVFQTKLEAFRAMDSLPGILERSGVVFAIEAAG